MTTKIIYGLSGPDGRLRYVGVSKNDLTYVIQHHRAAARSGKVNTPVNNWIVNVGFDQFKGEVLEEVDASDAKDRQQYWIDNARANGFDIVNLTKEQISARVKKSMSDPSVRERLRQTRPKVYRAKPEGWVSRKGQTGRHITEEHKAAVSRAHKGKKLSEETKAKIAEKALGHKRNEGRVQSEGTRLKMSWTKHNHFHVDKGIVKDGCRWCAGDVLELS